MLSHESQSRLIVNTAQAQQYVQDYRCLCPSIQLATSSHRIDWALEGLINMLPEVAQRNRTVACIAEEDAAGTHSHDVYRDKK